MAADNIELARKKQCQPKRAISASAFMHKPAFLPDSKTVFSTFLFSDILQEDLRFESITTTMAQPIMRNAMGKHCE